MRPTLTPNAPNKAGRGSRTARPDRVAGPGPAYVSRRQVALIVAALLAIAAGLPAWGQRVTSLQVVLWDTGVQGQRECMSTLVRNFQRENPDVIICTDWRASEYAEDWVRRWTGSYADHAPDIALFTDLWLASHYVDLVTLPDEMQADLTRRIPGSVLARGKHGGALCGVPWVAATEALYYRSDLLGDAGLAPPKSAAGLVQCAIELADPPSRYGFGVPGPGLGGEGTLHALATGLGVTADDDGATKPTASPFVDALQMLVQMQSGGGLQPEVLTWSEVELARLMAQGRLAMMVGRPWVDALLRQAEEDRQTQLAEAVDMGEDGEGRARELRAQKIEWSQAPLPRAEGGATHLAVDWLVVFGNTDASEQALRFLRFVAEEDSQLALAMLGGVPATKRLAAELGGTTPWAGHLQGLADARGLPLQGWDLLSRQLSDALNYAISGRRTPAEALANSAQ